jgi:hypothetical protein
MPTDAELYRCRECKVWDPEKLDSQWRELERNPSAYDNRWFQWVKTGQYAYGVELSVELILCTTHEPKREQ